MLHLTAGLEGVQGKTRLVQCARHVIDSLPHTSRAVDRGNDSQLSLSATTGMSVANHSAVHPSSSNHGPFRRCLLCSLM